MNRSATSTPFIWLKLAGQQVMGLLGQPLQVVPTPWWVPAQDATVVMEQVEPAQQAPSVQGLGEQVVPGPCQVPPARLQVD